MGSIKCNEPLEIEVKQAKIKPETAKWIDRDRGSGNLIKKAGYGQTVCAYVDYEGLEDEQVYLDVYDDDSTGDNIVFSIQGELKGKTGMYWPFKLSDEVKKKIEAKGIYAYGDLYFKIRPLEPDLKVENGDNELAKHLRVSDKPELVNAYFTDNADKQKLKFCKQNEKLYFKVYATNYVGKKVKIHFITVSDGYYRWKGLQLQKWADIKDYFKNENFFHSVEANFNQNGEILVEVPISKLGTPKKHFLINGAIEIPAEHGGEAQGAYVEMADRAFIFKTNAQAEELKKAPAPLMVDRVSINTGEHKHEDGKCPRCEEDITLKQLNNTVGNENDQDYRQRIVKYLNQFINERKGKSNELHINTCLLKAHFVSQIVTETSLLKIKLTEGETGPYYSKDNIKELWPGKYNEMVKNGTLENVSSERPQKQLLNYVYGSKNGNKGGDDGWNYRGKGLIQLTGRGNYKDAATYLKNVFPEKYVNFEEKYDKPAEEIYAVLSAIAFWEGKGVYNIAKDKKEVSDVPLVRNLINHHDRTNPKAQTYFKNAVEAFKVNDCTPISINAKEIITYRIYWNAESKGKIEKHVPKEIKEEYKNKYKYVYIDKNNFEHDICVVEWHKTKEKSVGHLKDSKPTHSAILSDETVSEGNTTRRVKYENGDIAEYGSHPSKGKIWRLYVAGSKEIELVKMPDSLNYVKDGIVIKYSFSSSHRRYTSPGHLAGFIGGLAENGFTITTTGSCFKEGSAFPSYDHSNGKSIDTLYLNDADEQKFINSLVKFNFNIHLRGSNSKKFTHTTDGGALHNSHLHSSFNESTITEVKE